MSLISPTSSLISNMSTVSIEDWLQINELFTRYATALDNCEVDAVLSCFTENGRIESPALGSFIGHVEIRDFAERTAGLKENHGAQFRHVLSNLRADVTGDRARATCYLLDFITRDGATELLSPGQYECTLRRSEGGWLFDSRIVVMDRTFAIKNMTDTSKIKDLLGIDGKNNLSVDTVVNPTDHERISAEPDHETTNAGAEKVVAQRQWLPAICRKPDLFIVRSTEFSLFAIGVLFTLMVTLEVISRYLFDFSISFVNAAAKILLVWFFLLGAGIALRHGAHVGFELLLTHLAPKRRRLIVLTGEFLALLFFIEMVWGGIVSLGPAFQQTEPGLGISLVWAFLAIPVGFLLLIYHMVILIAVEYKKNPDKEIAP